MRIVCQQMILMKYHALFVIFEKAAKFEVVVCCKLWVALYGLRWIIPDLLSGPLVKSVYQKTILLFLNQNICCGYSKEEPSQWDGSFEHPKHLLKLMGKKIFTILRSKILLI